MAEGTTAQARGDPLLFGSFIPSISSKQSPDEQTQPKTAPVSLLSKDPSTSKGNNQTTKNPFSLKSTSAQDLKEQSIDGSLHPNKTEVELAFLGKSPLLIEDSTQPIPCVSFPTDVKQELLDKLNHFVIAKFTHGRPPFKDFEAFLASLNLVGRFRVISFDPKHVFIEVERFVDFVKLWLIRSTSIKGYKVRLFQWTDSFNPTSESPLSPVWVHLPSLPLFLLDEAALIAIGSAIGRVLFIDPENLERKKIGYASLCLELDTSVSQPQIVRIEFVANGKVQGSFVQKIVYENMAPYCSVCLHIGHAAGSCKTAKIDKVSNPRRTSAEQIPVQVEVCFEALQESNSNSDQSAGKHLYKVNQIPKEVSESATGHPEGNVGTKLISFQQEVRASSVSVDLDRLPVQGKSDEVEATESEKSEAELLNKEAVSVRLPRTPGNGKSAVVEATTKQTEDAAMNVLHTYVLGCVSGAKNLDGVVSGEQANTRDYSQSTTAAALIESVEGTKSTSASTVRTTKDSGIKGLHQTQGPSINTMGRNARKRLKQRLKKSINREMATQNLPMQTHASTMRSTSLDFWERQEDPRILKTMPNSPSSPPQQGIPNHIDYLDLAEVVMPVLSSTSLSDSSEVLEPKIDSISEMADKGKQIPISAIQDMDQISPEIGPPPQPQTEVPSVDHFSAVEAALGSNIQETQPDQEAEAVCSIPEFTIQTDIEDLDVRLHVLTQEETELLIIEKMQLPKKYAEQADLQKKVQQLVKMCGNKLIRDKLLVHQLVRWLRQSISWGNSKPPKDYEESLASTKKPVPKTKNMSTPAQKSNNKLINHEYNLRSNTTTPNIAPPSAKFSKENFKPP